MTKSRPLEENTVITIATFYDPFQAYVIKSRFDSEEIPCYLADGNLLPTVSFFSNEGGVKLKIRKEDIERAKELLSKTY